MCIKTERFSLNQKWNSKPILYLIDHIIDSQKIEWILNNNEVQWIVMNKDLGMIFIFLFFFFNQAILIKRVYTTYHSWYKIERLCFE